VEVFWDTVYNAILCQHIRELQTSKNSPFFGPPCTYTFLLRPVHTQVRRFHRFSRVMTLKAWNHARMCLLGHMQI